MPIGRMTFSVSGSRCQPTSLAQRDQAVFEEIEVLEEAEHPEVEDEAEDERERAACPAPSRGRGSGRPRKSTIVDPSSRLEEAPVPGAVEVVARGQQHPVLRAMRQHAVQRVDDREEHDEMQRREDHQGRRRPGEAAGLEELEQRVGDDVMAARRQVHVALEEQARCDPAGRPAPAADRASARPSGASAVAESLGRRIPNQLAARLPHDLAPAARSPRRRSETAPA